MFGALALGDFRITEKDWLCLFVYASAVVMLKWEVVAMCPNVSSEGEHCLCAHQRTHLALQVVWKDSLLGDSDLEEKTIAQRIGVERGPLSSLQFHVMQ